MYTVYNAVNSSHHGKLKPNEVFLDNQADISIIDPMLLQHMKASKWEVNVNRVGVSQ
jgi:hypothetical protein